MRNNSEQPGVLPSRRSRDQVRSYYDRISGIYDLLAGRSEAPVRQQALQLLAARAGESVLEVGFGTGSCLPALARTVGPRGRVYGIDLSQGMLRRAVDRLRRCGLVDRAVLCRGDAARMPYADGLLDAVFMSFTLELFDTAEIGNVLLECRRVLRPSGRIVVAGMSRGDGTDRRVRLFQWAHLHFPGLMDCRPIHVGRAVRSAGFEVRQTVVTGTWVPVEIVLGEIPRNKESQ